MEPLDAFHADARRAAEAVAGVRAGARWLLHCDTDADGLASAAIAALALRAVGHRFHVQASRDKTASVYRDLFRDGYDGFLIMDKGTSHLEDLAEGAVRTGCPVIVLDHHNLVGEVPDGVHLVNPRAVGLDGSNDASSSTTTLSFAIALVGERAWEWAGIALVGAIGDWQHMGGWDGWNRAIVEEARNRGRLLEKGRPAFVGVDVADAIARRAPIPDLHEDAAAARAFLEGLGIPAAGDVEALTDAEQTRLVTGVVLAGLAAGAEPARLHEVTQPMLEAPSLGGLRHAFRTVDACGREGHAGTGVAFLMGDEAARAEADEIFQRYRAFLTEAIARLRRDGTAPRRACQVFTVDDPAYTGMVAGIGMSVVVVDRERPMVVHATRPDGDVQVSTRGLDGQVERGLDLGAACREAGQTVGREGGGHPIAAGVVVSPGDVDAFIDALDEVLTRQGFLGAS